MTRWAMVADLNRCVGCQTCTAACKHANATLPQVQWRKVLDIESGEFPDVRRTFVPVGCMHCIDPPCMHVCPSTATGRRADGIVFIDYDLCIGCAYCAVACPYQARYKVDRPRPAYGSAMMKSEIEREDPRRLGVAQKCTFCSDRVDLGLASGMVPGVDPEATPACVNACIADALHFGDLDDAESNVSRLLRGHKHFHMHTELATRPGFFYLWDKADGDGDGGDHSADPIPIAAGSGGLAKGIAPWLQQHWDWRAAGNFMCGGSGTGLAAFAAAAAVAGASFTPLGLASLGLVGLGLFLVWLEIGRPWRFINVLFNPKTSWMTREAMAGLPFFAVGLAAVWFDTAPLAVVAAAIGLAFLYCQARLVQASTGIPAWRHPRAVPLLVVTGLAEGGGLLMVASLLLPDVAVLMPAPAIALLVLILLRFVAWSAYHRALRREGAPTETLKALARLALPLAIVGHSLPTALILIGFVAGGLAPACFALAGLVAFLGGWLFKFALITRAGFNQGFAIVRTPARGAGESGPGIKPGWEVA